MTVGDFVAVNAFLIQLYMPLNMLGFVYREISNALVEHGEDVRPARGRGRDRRQARCARRSW